MIIFKYPKNNSSKTSDTNLEKSVRKENEMNPSQNPSAVRSKEEITNTLLRLMDTYSYNDITVKQILLESQVARKTFYRNFLSKDDVLDAHIDSIMQQYIYSLEQLPDSQLSNILDIILSLCLQNRDLFIQLKNNNLMHLLLHKWNTFIPIIHKKLVSPNHPMFQVFSDEQIDYVIAFNNGAVWNVIMKWAEHDMKDSPDTIKTILLKHLANLSFFT